MLTSGFLSSSDVGKLSLFAVIGFIGFLIDASILHYLHIEQHWDIFIARLFSFSSATLANLASE